MNEVAIREATAADVPFLWEMLYESLYVREGEKPFPKDIIYEPALSKYVEGWGRAGDYGLIAATALGTSVGAITYRYFEEDNQGYGFVHEDIPELEMAVAEGYRGHGIGTRLMKDMLMAAKSKGIQALSLSVDPNNPVYRMYKRFGFYEVGTAGTSITMRIDF